MLLGPFILFSIFIPLFFNVVFTFGILSLGQVHLGPAPQNKQDSVPLDSQSNDSDGQTISFRLNSVFATTNTSRVLFADVGDREQSALTSANHPTSYSLRAKKISTHRPSSLEAFNRARFSSYFGSHDPATFDAMLWEEDEVLGPDTTDRETILLLAKMTNNAYNIDNEEDDWYDIGEEWNKTTPFGWDREDDGFRGHVFVSEDNSTVIISIKGTSAAVLGRGGPTAKKDKLNDNLLFSCCCAKVGFSWTPVCGCYIDGWRCHQDCLEQSLLEDSLFYPIGIALYNEIVYSFPRANIWIAGHSLGGSLASLIGATFGVPVVAFEAPGERMAAQRLHLPSPPSTLHITHIYHTADPIPMGVCTGVLSTCALVGYALESRCHLGQSIIYDTVTELNWSVNVAAHRIRTVIDSLLSNDWKDGKPLPDITLEDGCIDCYSWEFVNP